MKRALVLVLALAVAVALVYALRPAVRAAREDAGRGPHAEIDDASRAQLEKVLREAAREPARPPDAKPGGAKPR